MTTTPNDKRFTAGLMFDVVEVLKRHGYKKHPDARANADVLVSLLALVDAFEGNGGALTRSTRSVPERLARVAISSERCETWIHDSESDRVVTPRDVCTCGHYRLDHELVPAGTLECVHRPERLCSCNGYEFGYVAAPAPAIEHALAEHRKDRA